MYETVVTIVGNLVDEPRMRTTDSGIEVAGFRIASTSRRFDRQSGEWVDGASVYLGVTCWRALGINVVASLTKGDPVVVYGKLQTRQYEKDGQTRSSYELDAFAVGPDLGRGTASFRRLPRSTVPPTYSVTDADGVPAAAGHDDDGQPPHHAETTPDDADGSPAGDPGEDTTELDAVPAGAARGDGLLAVAG
jgi:single-strand DNA-binding protein